MRARAEVACFPAILLLGAAVSFAGPERVAFPSDYRERRPYATVDGHDNETARDLYANAAAVRAARAGEALPSGSVLSMEVYQAKTDGKGALLRGADGRFVKDGLVGIFVMEKRTGWGVEYGDGLRNGDWEYARFGADGRRQNADMKPCLECHKTENAQDHMFSLKQLRSGGR